MESNQGYVYIMINPSFQGVVKIGKCNIDPNEFAQQLSAKKGVPSPYILIYYKTFIDCIKAEKSIHSILEARGLRLDPSSELFSIDTTDAINILLSIHEDKVDNNEMENTPHDNSVRQSDLAESLYFMGLDYSNGTDEVFQDKDKAIECYERSAQLGYVSAFRSLADLLFYNKNEAEKAIYYLKAGAELGDWRCYADLAFIYERPNEHYTNKHNAELSWKKYFEHLGEYDLSNNPNGLYIKGIMHDCIKYLYEILDDNSTPPEAIENVIYENREQLLEVLREDIPYLQDMGYDRIADIYSRKILPYLERIEEHHLLSHGEGIKLAKNYFTIAEKYLFGNEQFAKNEIKALNLFNKSAELGYSKALVYSGYCWLCKNKREKASELWKKYYNSVYAIIADDEIHETEEQKNEMIETFFIMYKFAIEKDAQDLIHDYYFMMSLHLGILGYVSERMEEFNNAPIYTAEEMSLNADSITELVGNAENLIKAVEWQRDSKILASIYTFIRTWISDFQTRCGSNPMMHRLDD